MHDGPEPGAGSSVPMSLTLFHAVLAMSGGMLCYSLPVLCCAVCGAMLREERQALY